MAKSTSVIIPNYNGRHLLEIILPPLYVALKKTDQPYEIIISDDASTDDSVVYIRKKYPDIIITENHKNAGFSVAVNRGAALAQYDLLLLLNNDVKLTEDYFLSMLHYFDKKDTFGVNGRVIGWEDEKIQDAAKFPYFQGGKLKTNRNYYYKTNTSSDLFTFYLTGSNALIDRRKFLEIGGLNEIFSPFYCEDLEISVRAWKASWKCYYEHNAICRHKVSATTTTQKKKQYVEKIYNRNKFIFHYLHLSGLRYFCYVLQISLEAIGKILKLDITYLQSLILFLRNVGDYNKKIKSNYSINSKISINEILKFIEEKTNQKEIVFFKS